MTKDGWEVFETIDATLDLDDKTGPLETGGVIDSDILTKVGNVTGVVGSTLVIVDSSIGVELPGRCVSDGSAVGIVSELIGDALVVVAGASVGKFAALEDEVCPLPDETAVLGGCPPLFSGNESVALASIAGVVSCEGIPNEEGSGSCPSVMAGVLEA